jgi:hypothetical protein
MTGEVHLASIGMSCQTRYQIELYAGAQGTINDRNVILQTGYFDWLICTPAALCDLLDSGFPDFRSNELSVRKERAWWSRFDIYFWHDFLDKDIESPVPAIKNLWSRVKFVARRRKFAMLDPIHTLFVFSNTQNNLSGSVYDANEKAQFMIDEKAIDQVQKSMDSFFGTQCNLLFVSQADRMSAECAHDPRVEVIPAGVSEWKGEAEQWHPILTKHLSRLQ